jgi:hypothetical protein
MTSSRSEILQSLAQRIQEIESSHHSPGRAPISLGVPGLEEIVPEKQLPAGSLVEIFSAAEGAGTWTLALLLARQACVEGKAFVIADMRKSFYPPAASRLGVNLDRSLVVCPSTWRDASAAVVQSLHCPAVGAVVVWCDPLPLREFRRFQVAAEAGGGLGLLLRPAKALHAPSFAALRLLVTPVASAERPRRIRVDVVRARGDKGGQSLTLEIDDETGHVCVPAGLADPAAPARAARASG